MTPTAAIEVRDLLVRRSGRDVLHSISLEVPRGAVVGLLGPSGGGKSTLLRSIVGSQIVAGGAVTVLGLPAGSRALRSRIGYVTQAPSVYDDLTVRENLRYFAGLVGAGTVRADAVIERVDLGSHADALAGRLSGGQRSRVSLAAALVGEPEVLILDEPTVGLDPVLRVRLWKMFRSLAAAGTTVLVSSHVMDEATRCDRLVFLRDGQVIADDTLDEITRRTGTSDAEAAFLTLAEGEEA